MFEEMTFDYILKTALSNVSGNVDKREGSIIYDAIAPCCLELSKIYQNLDEVIKQTFASSADREFLIKRAEERGIYPKDATSAVMKGVFNINVPIGSRFYIDGLTYFVSSKISDNVFELTCEIDGTDGHRHFGKLLPLDNIDGLESAEITEIIVTGQDAEDTEVFRKRYFDSFSALAFGGNKQDYIEKINLISGVGGCKVYPAFYGGGTVKIVVISSGYGKISSSFAKQILQLADPYNCSGQGVGFAPIGHKVYIESVSEKPIDIMINMTFDSTFDEEYIHQKLYEIIYDYFYELSKGWADTSNIDISPMKIGTEVFEIKGIKNISDVKVKGEESFSIYSLLDNEIPILNSIYVNDVKVVI